MKRFLEHALFLPPIEARNLLPGGPFCKDKLSRVPVAAG